MNKESLRRNFMSARMELSALELQSKTGLICQRLINLVDWSALNLVHLYLPVLENHEIDTFPILKHIRANYERLRIAVPKVEPGNQLSHYLFNSDTKLETNLWGIQEPIGATPVAVEEIDLVIAPMIIFDKEGHRIGYGKGYYDRFLAGCRTDTTKIGLCYFDPVRQIEIEPTDIAMNKVVTPEGVWEFDQ